MTMDQLSIIPEDVHEAAWRQFNRDNGLVFNQIIRIAAQAKDRGETRLSMKWIFECIRRDIPRGGNAVALDNSWSACAARQLIQERPDLAPLFRTRRRKI